MTPHVDSAAGRIIYLHGTSSSGKTSIAKALHPLIGNCEVVESDAFEEQFQTSFQDDNSALNELLNHYASLDRKLRLASDFNVRNLLFDELYDLTEAKPFPDGCAPEIEMFKTISRKCLPGRTIIVDDVIPVDRIFKECLRILGDHQVYFIRVDCIQSELERREMARGDRIPGAAAYQLERIHIGKCYDFSVDTSCSRPLLCAIQIRDFVLENQHKAFIENRKLFSDLYT